MYDSGAALLVVISSDSAAPVAARLIFFYDAVSENKNVGYIVLLKNNKNTYLYPRPSNRRHLFAVEVFVLMVQTASVGGGGGREASKVGSLRSRPPCGLSKFRWFGECAISLAANSVILNMLLVFITGVELTTGMGSLIGLLRKDSGQEY